MSYFFLDPTRWFYRALCRRYLVVRIDRLRVPTRDAGTAEWSWALGFFTDGRVEVLGAWRDEGPAMAQRIAADLHDRGIERIDALVGDDSLLDAAAGLCPRWGRPSAAELAECRDFTPRLRQAIRWTDAAARRLQDRMQRAARRQVPFIDDVAASAFVAQAFRRADRDLLDDRPGRARPAPYGAVASAAFMGAAG